VSLRTCLAAVGLMAACVAAHAGSVDLPAQIGGAFSIKVRSLKEARFAATVRQQYDFSCGSAALSTLLTHHYDHPVDEQRVFQEMFERGDRDKIRREGFSLLDMKRYLEAHGFEADGFEASLESLAEAAVPAIALINERGYNHFVVIKGLRDGRVLIGDPAGGTRAVAAARFEALRVNTILFVIGNRQETARFNAAADWAVLPRAPLASRLDSSAAALALPKLGATDF
jgi:predicted double-glycine peptidase